MNEDISVSTPAKVECHIKKRFFNLLPERNSLTVQQTSIRWDFDRYVFVSYR
jgi:glutathione peroxidase-family protein